VWNNFCKSLKIKEIEPMEGEKQPSHIERDTPPPFPSPLRAIPYPYLLPIEGGGYRWG